MKTIAVIGGGPAGLMAAGTALSRGNNVYLFDANGTACRKLRITGKGRCNVTNNCDNAALLANVVTNPRFLMGCFARFTPQDTIAFFEKLGVPLKTERGNRVFPQSDNSEDICRALRNYVSGATIIKQNVLSIETENGAVACVRTADKIYPCDAAILATGGLSYPTTGSTGDGYRIAVSLGHTIIPQRPALVPLTSENPDCVKLQGLSLKNVRLEMLENNKVVFSDIGELLFTHFGLSGPLVLSASSKMRDFKSNTYTAVIDLKPGLDEDMLDKRILRDFSQNINRNFANSLSDLLPSKLIPVIVERSGIPADEKVNSITKTQRTQLVKAIKHFSVEISGTRPIAEAIVTSGGVCVKEINPKTMESKLISGLFFAGEIIDADAFTGGFNLQIAWSTGFTAGSCV